MEHIKIMYFGSITGLNRNQNMVQARAISNGNTIVQLN